VCEQGQFNCTQERCEEVNQCPGSLVYSPHSCLLTCSSLDPPGQQQGSSVALTGCRQPLSGCVCPQGTVLLGDKCVQPDECPCHHNGQLYYNNDTITKDCNTCVCKERRWHCSQSACAGVCVATGDPHYVTFDGRCYSFLGDCQYVLARETSGLFSVIAENVPCGSTGVTCTKSVTLSLGNTVIHLLRGKAVTVNGMPVSLPKSYSGSGLTLERVGLFVSLSSRLGVTLLWDGGMRVYVRLAAHLRGRVSGLCGNFDGDTENDFTTRQGIVESTAELFGNSWKVSPSCPDVADQDLRDPCALNPHRVTWARKRCAVLTQELFSRCHPEVPFQQYYDWCVFDACGCDSGGDCECLCTAISAYAEECNHKGVYIRWRSQELCPLQCDNGMVYDPCGPACSSSCPTVQRSPHSQCGTLSCVEGCFCPAGTVRHGDSCVVPVQCPCEWEGSMFPPGTTVTQHCQNCSCEAGVWQCKGVACPPVRPPCLESEFTCAGGRCIPSQWVCDNENDCGDGSDEICLSTYCGVVCDEGEFLCAGGRCILYLHRCDGHDDCGDLSDERGCVCAPGEFQCPGDQCVPANRVCDGHTDCPSGTDEAVCPSKVTCAPDQFACSDGTCVTTTKLCDGTTDCPGGEDENRTNCHTATPSPSPVTMPTSACRFYEFSCATGGQCVPQAWRCDGETDCMDGSDEQQCTTPCGPGQVPCLIGDQCVDYQQLYKTVSPVPPGRENTTLTCPEFTCMDGSCVPFKMVCNGVTDCPDSTLAPLGGPTDEQGCRSWSSWGPWSPCTASCGTGSMSRQRTCPEGDPLRQCRGQDLQRQQCFNSTCPVDGRWLPWGSWSNCSSCGGVQVRHRGCVSPRYGGRDCSQLPGFNLPMEIKPCPDDGCANTSCPTGLVRHSCAPCPVSCAHISSGTTCDSIAPCSPGCWCPDGQVMSHKQQCVLPEECVCEVAGLRYWPGQQIKLDCEICVCERGRPQRCQSNQDCSVHCGWSSWSEWGECLGPCGVQSVQWSFRSPNNPIKHGDGRTCRGIYRKARRCQTDPCDDCEYQGQSHAVGDRWRSDPCQLCHCLPNLTVQCSPYCPHAVSGCPQGQDLVPGEGDRCCYCQGGNDTITVTISPVTVTSKPAEGTTPLIPTYPLPPGDECWSPLGVQTLPASSFRASSQQTGHPPEAGRLHCPEPEEYKDLPQRRPEGHASTTQSPYLQIDLLKSYNITGVLTQGGGVFGTFVSSFYLQFSQDSRRWYTYKELVTNARPRAKVFHGNHDDRGVAESRLDRMVSAQFVRLLPHDFQNGIYLRLEIMGCGDTGGCRKKEFQCKNGRCVPAGPLGVVCDGVNDCGDGSDELYCGIIFIVYLLDYFPYQCMFLDSSSSGTAPTKGSPGLQNQTSSSGGPGFHGDSTTGAPGLHTTWSQGGIPGVESPGVTTTPSTGHPGLHLTTSSSGKPGLQTTTSETPASWNATTPDDDGKPRVLCIEGQFVCRSFGCVDSAQVCDGRQDCLDGSDEERCTTARPAVNTWAPQVPSPCSHKQFSCNSGECVHLDRRCDLQKDCVDGSDEKDCVDCIMSPWTAWSVCSVSCGLGSLFRQRDILREALPGGACGGAQFDGRACFPRACPVDGHWAEWSEWSECDAQCGGGVRQRNRSCSDPPPKNGGRDCGGMTLQSQSCNSQPCTKDIGTQTGCVEGMVLVTEADCQAGRVEPCPPTCSHLSSSSNCTAACVPGCRCPNDRYLQGGRCVNSSQCVCLWHGHTLQPGQTVNRDQCTACVCIDGQVTCDSSLCVAACHWSAWSSWSPCDVTCGLGLQQRYRSPVNPAGAVRVEPCPGDSSEVRRCSPPCLIPDGVWSKWTSWSECSKTCFNHVDDVGIRRRFRSCNHTLTHFNNTHADSACEGDSEEPEPCNTVHCPVNGGWSAWALWSQCSSECDSGVQTRQRSCSSPSPQHGGSSCPGPHIQTGDCNSHPCSGVCPEGMVNMTSAECEAHGGACPRVCLDMTPAEVECATACYDGCYCAPGFYLLNGSCVPLAHCPCYHQGGTYPAGTTLPVDACNNCTCTNGEMVCGAASCPVDCGWSDWTQWSACSRTCDVGVRRRYRSGTNPPAAFGGRPCRGDRVGIDTCSLEPCFGVKEPWSAWSTCSVTCGGGYRARTRGPIRIHGTSQQFSACNLQACGEDRVCPPGQQWKQCVKGAVSCTDLTMDLGRNCTPGCQCPHGSVQQDGVCVRESKCRCDLDGEQYHPGETVPSDCNNCTCEAGRLVNCSQVRCNVDGQWSSWTPWGRCSVSCGAGLQSRYRFCSSPERSGSGLPCLGPHREDQVCLAAPCDRDGGWGRWSNWTDCTKSCGGGVQSRRRECDSPRPEGEGNYCEGLGSEVIACNTSHCPVAPCSKVPGTAFSSCGPSCPRSCDDLAHCEWQCEPGCYCTEGKILSANGTVCVEREDCLCIDLNTGHRLEPGETTEAPDGCNNCTCQGGRLNCTRYPCPVSGGWCEWSEWTPCSRTCGAESVSRYRSCSCPEPNAGGVVCSGEQEIHNGVGVQIQRQPCPVITFCPVHGSWSPWSPWSECDGCAGSSARTRDCNSPPAKFGGLPCLGESRQRRGCYDNITICSDCGGGQEEWPCGKPCPRSCSDLHSDTECLDPPGCTQTCGCPGDMLLQDGVCIARAECRCKYHNSSDTGMTFSGLYSSNASWEWPGGSGWQFAEPGDSIISDCNNCSCEYGVMQCQSVPGCYVDGDSVGPWLPWSRWSACSVSCGGGQQARSRLCSSPPCSGLRRQSKTCNTQVCLEVGCPPGRLYRECERGEGCPFSCAHVSGREGCYSDGCEEGCHCPHQRYQHHGVCLQECPCLVDKDLLASLQSVSVTPVSSLLLHNVTEGGELQPGDTLVHDCSTCGCEHGRWNCSLEHCPVDGRLSPWGPWSPCSLSCGGLGLKTRSKTCTQPTPAHGGRDCQGPRQETTYCQAPDCPVVVGPTEEPVLPGRGLGLNVSVQRRGLGRVVSVQRPRSRQGVSVQRPKVLAWNVGTRQRSRPVCRCQRPGSWLTCRTKAGVKGRDRRYQAGSRAGIVGTKAEVKADILTSRQFGPRLMTGMRWSRRPTDRQATVEGPQDNRQAGCGRGGTGQPQARLIERTAPRRLGSGQGDPKTGREGTGQGKPSSAADERTAPGPVRIQDKETPRAAVEKPAPRTVGVNRTRQTSGVGSGKRPPGRLKTRRRYPPRTASDRVARPRTKRAVAQDGRGLGQHQKRSSGRGDFRHQSGSSRPGYSRRQGSGSSGRGTHDTESGSSGRGLSRRQKREPGPGRSRKREYEPGDFKAERHRAGWLPGDERGPQQALGWNLDGTGAQHGGSGGRAKDGNRGPCYDVFCDMFQDGDEVCEGTDCAERNCSWKDWGEWSSCSRSCGVGQQQKIRTFLSPRSNGSWCEDILGGNLEHRFCNIKPCRVDGGWSRWSPWSRCDKRCGGGRSIRTRSCSSPPPKNGGKKCEGEKNQVKPCNTKPCDEKGCPPGQEFVSCANQCPQRCSDLQQGIECQDNTDCQPGCRCPKGQLQQDGVCVQLWQCDCTDSLGQIWAAGSVHQVDCNNCSCSDGQLFCTNHSCQASCTWSSWSSWALCSVSCGKGQRTRYRSLVPETEGADCQFEEVQHKSCDPGPCPPLCLHDDQELTVGDTWLQGECKQCTCTPEGDYCQDIECRVDGGWTPWSVWSDCSVTCGRGTQVHTRACINPPPRNNGSHCSGPERETQDCHTPPCLDDLCPWSPWSPCSRSCGAGSVLRRRVCVCEEGGDAACPSEIEAERNREETQLCYKRPCPDCPMSGWSVWSPCSCQSQRQQRYRVALSPATRGQQCTPVETQSRTCSLSQCGDCEAPFEYSACGAPCEKQCVLQGRGDLCSGVRECTPGCYCPQGLLQQNGTCVPPEECGCIHLQHQASGPPPTPVTLPQGAMVTIGCSRQLLVLQAVCCSSGPTQAVPPGSGSLRTVLFRDDNPPPQEVLHSLQDDHSPNKHPTGGRDVGHRRSINRIPTLLVTHMTQRTRMIRMSSMTDSEDLESVKGSGFSISKSNLDMMADHSSPSAWCSHRKDRPLCPGKGVSWSSGPAHRKLSTSSMGSRAHKPGTGAYVCQRGLFNCSSEICDVCPDGERWKRSESEEVPLCERSCEDIYSSSPVNCSHSTEGCVCEDGLYRNSEGVCVIPALCPCHDQGIMREAGSEWDEGCLSCHCVNGKQVCQLRCPPLYCEEGEVKVEEPGSCCPVCRKQFPDEPVPECRRYVQVRNITKGDCRLDNVEVSFCRGRCLSRTDVILEEPYLQSVCECCSYRLDPETPVRFLSLQCESGESEPVVLPVIHSCECTSCQGGDLSRR
ncbi:SCO-spondin, partial [Notothenia coriiceps]|uniref:SCO-spondin n=1 Tax=Notothenia coriiceps TaxID=8208 RepID=A0A6I9MVP3_9TELE